MTPNVRVIACPSPFSVQKVEARFECGPSLGALLSEMGVEPAHGTTIRVLLDDLVIKLEDFYSVYPQPGQVVTARVVPQDPVTIGVLLSAAAQAAAAASTFAGAVGLGGALSGFAGFATGLAGAAGLSGLGITAVSLGAQILGGAAILGGAISAGRSLTAKPSTGLGGSATAESSPTITGTRNNIRKFAVVPRCFGKYRIFPMLGAKLFTEVIGNEQFLRLLFVPGYGPLELDETEFRIGETALSSFGEVETEIRQGFLGEPPLTLITQEVDEDTINVEFEAPTVVNNNPIPGNYVKRTTKADTEEITLGLFFPSGLITRTTKGSEKQVKVGVDVQFSVKDADTWQTPTLDIGGQPATEQGIAGQVIFTGLTNDQLQRAIKFTVPNGHYDVRIRFADISQGIFHPTRSQADFRWTVLRSARPLDPISLDGVAKIALRIKATDELSGTIDTFSCLVESRHPVYDPANPLADAAGFVANVRTRNPAWHALDILRGSANKSAVADSKIDLVAFQNWAADNDANDRTFDGVFDFDSTVLEAFNKVASVGRASFDIRDGKFSIVQDKQQTSVVQHFTPRNSSGFKGTKAFVEQPDALRVRFQNELKDYLADELLVFADGQTAETAAKFEALDIWGITNPEKVWKEARFHQAIAKNRIEEFELTTDFEYLVCERGDLVLVGHDVPLIGLAYGRIKTLTVDGGSNVTDVTLDEQVTFEDGKSYALRIRSIDASGNIVSTEQNTTNPATGGPDVTTNSITFTSAIAAANGVAVDDLAIFGEQTLETEEFIVQKIEPQQDLSAVLTLIPHAPSIFSADAGPVPLHESKVTVGPNDRPPTPVIDDVISEPGRFILRVHVNTNALVPPVRYEVSFRTSDPVSDWGFLPEVSITVAKIPIAPVAQDVFYDIRVRTISASGLGSTFVQLDNVKFTGDETRASDFKISGLELVGQGNDNIFTGRDAVFAWRVNSRQFNPDMLEATGQRADLDTLVENPIFQSFEVRISDFTTGAIVRTEQVTGREYAYTFDKNQSDAGGAAARRKFVIDVAFRDILGTVGPRTGSTFENPAPPVPLDIVMFAGDSKFGIAFTPPRDRDFKGMLVWGSTTQGFSVSDATLVADGSSSPIPVEVTLIASPETWYARVSPYDDFAVNPSSGKVDLALLNTSAELSTPVLVLNIADGTLPGAKIVPLSITSALIGDLQVLEGKIAALAVTNAKIAALAVDTAKIANLAVDTLQVNNFAITRVGSDSLLEPAFFNIVGSATVMTVDMSVTNESSVIVQALVSYLHTGLTQNAIFEVRRDGTVLMSLNNALQSGPSGPLDTQPFGFNDTNATASPTPVVVTYEMHIRHAGGAGNELMQVKLCSMIVMESRR